MKKTLAKILITLTLLHTVALPLYAFVPEITANASSFGSATAETVAGAVAGAALATHGVDDMQAGFRQFMTGRDTDTMTSGLMQSAGISRNTANNIETIGSALATGGASYLSTAASSTIAAETEMVTVSRWGREGLESGDWVMKGGTSARNYLLSGKYQPESWPGNNLPAAYSTGQNYIVPNSTLNTPPGILGPIKGVFGQRIYNP
jgi:hypothetical protein